MEINNIYNIDCLSGLKQLDDNSVNLTVTSPPYDDLRTYQGTCNWNFEVFKPIAEELYRVTKPGGIVVWVVGDAVVNGGETGSSFKQALYFQEIGFKIHDTMIYHKNSSAFPAKRTSKRYTQIFEYMFVFVKGKIRNDITLIADKKNKWAGWTNWGQHSQYDAEGNLVKASNIKPIAEFSLRTNIWKYSVSFNDKIVKHPAVFPEELARDCILSWSVEGDVVLDPFMGSGTTAKMALLNNRNYIGFEINEDYYNGILKRIDKFKNNPKEDVFSMPIEIDGEKETCLITENPEDDKEVEEKTKLFNKLVEQLNEYFNEQSLSILKTLTLTFKSESNDKRVQDKLNEMNNGI
jgi:site-specific DNA-methyltransferase (adenine-specific)